MNLAEAKLHRLWRSLNDNEKCYLEMLTANGGDELAAVKNAYSTENPKSAAGLLNRMHRRFAVSFLAQRLMGQETTPDQVRGELLEHALLVLRNTSSEERRIKMIETCARLLGPAGKAKEPELPAQINEAARVDVGDLNEFRE